MYRLSSLSSARAPSRLVFGGRRRQGRCFAAAAASTSAPGGGSGDPRKSSPSSRTDDGMVGSQSVADIAAEVERMEESARRRARDLAAKSGVKVRNASTSGSSSPSFWNAGAGESSSSSSSEGPPTSSPLMDFARANEANPFESKPSAAPYDQPMADTHNGEELPEPRELEEAELCRAIWSTRVSGTLTTVDAAVIEKASSEGETDSEKLSSALFGGIVPFVHRRGRGRAEVPTESLSPVLWMMVKKDSAHRRHLDAHPRCSLVIQPPLPDRSVLDFDYEAMGNHAQRRARPPLPRINVRGTAYPLDNEQDRAVATRAFVEVHGFASAKVLENDEAAVYEFVPTDVYRQGRSLDVDPINFDAFCTAPSDPISASSQKISKHLRDTFGNDVDLLATVYGGAEVDPGSTFIYFLDRYGCNVMSFDRHGEWRDFRLPFPFVMTSVDECKSALEEVLNNLRESEQELKRWNRQ